MLLLPENRTIIGDFHVFHVNRSVNIFLLNRKIFYVTKMLDALYSLEQFCRPCPICMNKLPFLFEAKLQSTVIMYSLID